MKKITIFLVFIGISLASYGQNEPMEKAEDHAYECNYRNAIDLYTDALKNPEDRWQKSLIYYRIGDCYNELLDFDNAIKYFKLSYKIDRQDTDMLREIAYLLKRNEQYSESYEYLIKYKKKTKVKAKADSLINAHQIIMSWVTNPAPYKITLNKELSSPFFDYSPNFISQDKSTMIITSTRAFSDSVFQVGRKSNLYYSLRQDCKFRAN